MVERLLTVLSAGDLSTVNDLFVQGALPTVHVAAQKVLALDHHLAQMASTCCPVFLQFTLVNERCIAHPLARMKSVSLL